jgi:hypothetical protein
MTAIAPTSIHSSPRIRFSVPYAQLKARRFPSGDQAGVFSSQICVAGIPGGQPGSMERASDPSGLTVHVSYGLSSNSRWKTIRDPSRDQSG